MGKFLIYKSSAGSGKTTALIQIFLKLSLATENPNQFKRLLAITFTNKAADEMKERFIRELDKISGLDSAYKSGDFMVDYLIKEIGIPVESLAKRASRTFQIALQDYSDIGISTIDRFNHRLVRSFSRDLNIRQDFEVLVGTKQLYQDAVDLLIDKYGREPEVTKHLTAFMKLQFEQAEKINIRYALMNLESLVISDESHNAIKMLEGLDFHAIRKRLLDTKKELGEACRKRGQDLLNLCSNAGIGEKDLTRGSSGPFGFFNKLACFPEKELSANSYVKAAIEGKWLSKAKEKEIEPLLKPIQQELERKTREAVEFTEHAMSPYWLSDAILKNIHLIAVLEELARCIEEICNDNNFLPLYQFNAIISKMLRDEPVAFLYEHIGNRYAHILIDEYQDTSSLQWFNLLPLIEESLAKGNTSLVVGDAKQSIYRWRGGKAEQLIALPKLMDPPENVDGHTEAALIRDHQIENLNSNYRSAAQIVDFNNALFALLNQQIETHNELHNTAYTGENIEQRIAKNDQTGFVKIKQWSELESDDIRTEYIFNQMQYCIEKGYAYKDMVVLVRSSKDGVPIINKLRSEGIGVSTAESLELDSNSHINLIISFLRLLLDTSNNAAKIGIMRGFEFTKNIAFNPTDFQVGKQLDLEVYLLQNGFPAFHKVDRTLGIYDTIQAIINTYLPDVNDPFLEGLYEEVLNNLGASATVSNFLSWWDEQEKKPSLRSENTPNAVRVMTIHKSKGLQFKLVFMPKADWQLSTSRGDYRWFDLRNIPEARIPFAPLPVNSKLMDMGLEADWNNELDDLRFDNLNMLYVALTRAEHGMFLGFEYTEPKTKKKEDRDSHTGAWLIKAISTLKISYFPSRSGYCLEEENGEIEVSLGELQSNAADRQVDSKIIPFKPVTETQNWRKQLNPAHYNVSQDQKSGNIFHQIMAESTDLDSATKSIDLLRKRFAITADEQVHLKSMVETIFKDSLFQSMLADGTIFKETDLRMNGETLRPDLLVERENEIIVVDFKTGEHATKYEKQVQGYMEACSRLTQKPSKGFLAYVHSEIEWNEVQASGPIQTDLFD